MESRMIKATFLIVLPLFSIFTYAGHNKMNQDSLWQMIKEMKSVWVNKLRMSVNCLTNR